MELLLFLIGGRIYTWIELLWRGRTHWTMFVLGGFCFVAMGLLNEYHFQWNESLLKQSTVSACLITVLELGTGCIVNLWLGWNVWDYSHVPFNLWGQISLPFFGVWILLSMVGIIIDDWVRYLFYLAVCDLIPMQKREKPKYHF